MKNQNSLFITLIRKTLTTKASFVLFFLAALVASGAMVSPATAQSLPSTGNHPEQGLTISPFILERQMEKGQSLDETIEVTNTTNRTLPVDISVNDFAASGDNGQQVYFEPGEGDQTYALSKWIKINNSPKLVLNPGEKTELNFTISAPANAEDGGHYGAVLFSFTGAQAPGSSVQVTQKVSAIILVKLGKTREDGQIASFKTADYINPSTPVVFKTRFKNEGNVHVKPRGGISIYNMFGKKVGTAIVNENANNVLPNSERLFESTWSDKYAFGRYSASVDLVFGDSGTVVKANTSFWVIPFKLVGGIAIALIILIFLITYAIRRYNRWFMNKLMEQQPARKPRKSSK